MAITDLDEWLRPGAERDEVTLEVDQMATGLVLRASLVVTPAGRRVRMTISLARGRAVHEADEPGPPPSNWDRMRVGGAEWRMVEPLQRWELAFDDVEAGLRGYLVFSGSEPCVPRADGYEQLGIVSGQIHLAGAVTTVANAPARRTHTWLSPVDRVPAAAPPEALLDAAQAEAVDGQGHPGAAAGAPLEVGADVDDALQHPEQR